MDTCWSCMYVVALVLPFLIVGAGQHHETQNVVRALALFVVALARSFLSASFVLHFMCHFILHNACFSSHTASRRDVIAKHRVVVKALETPPHLTAVAAAQMGVLHLHGLPRAVSTWCGTGMTTWAMLLACPTPRRPVDAIANAAQRRCQQHTRCFLVSNNVRFCAPEYPSRSLCAHCTTHHGAINQDVSDTHR